MSRGGKCVSEIMYRVCRYVCKEEKQSKGGREGEPKEPSRLVGGGSQEVALFMVLEGEGRERPYTFPREAYRPNDPPPPPPPTYSQEIPPTRPPLVSQSPHAKKLEEAPQEEAHSFTRPPCHTLQGSEKVQATTLWIICEKIAVRLCATACQQVLLFLFLGRSHPVHLSHPPSAHFSSHDN